MRCLVTGLACWLISAISCAADDPSTRLDGFLKTGDVSGAVDSLTAHLKERPDDANAHFELGVAQYLDAVTQFTSDLAPYGPGRREAKKFEKLTYRRLRNMMTDFSRRLRTARASLDKAPDQDVRVQLDLRAVRWDIDGDGKADALKALLPMIAKKGEGPVEVVFDRSDVHWFLAQVHFMKAVNDGLLAHDWRDFFERVGHHLFANVDTPYGFLLEEDGRGGFGVDDVAAIHLINWKVNDPKRLRQCWRELDRAAHHAQQLLKSIAAEEDNDREWIAHHDQTPVLSGFQFKKGQYVELKQLADDIRGLLQGKSLMPLAMEMFANNRERRSGRGINIKRFFHESQRFDLVMWIHGSDVVPYLEEGEVHYDRWFDFWQGKLFRDLNILGVRPFFN